MPPKKLAALACLALACGPTSGDTDGATTTTTNTPTTSTTAPTTTGTTTDAPTTTSNDTDILEDPCLQVPDPGFCDAGFDRFFFDPATQRCDVFTYGGCDGVVPFEDAASCQQACEPCEAFAGDVTPTPAHPEVVFTIRNESQAAIFLRTYTPDNTALGYREQPFEVRQAGASEPLITAPNWCDFPCAFFDNDQCAAGCSDGNPPPPPILIEPGGAFPDSWSGLHFDTTAMPARCQPAACEGELECGRWFESWPGAHEVRAVVASGWECLGPDCTCTANADGWCQLPGGEGLGGPIDAVELSAPFTFPGEGPVSLSFP